MIDVTSQRLMTVAFFIIVCGLNAAAQGRQGCTVVTLSDPPRDVVRCVERIAQAIYDGIFARERGQARFSDRQLVSRMKPLATILAKYSPKTAESAKSFIEYIESGRRRDRDLREFRPWWGRGQQYLSFLRR